MESESSSINVDSASKTIILHPGSHSVKFGIASDPWPQFVLNAIAFRTNGAKAPGLKSPNKIITKAKHTTGAFKITIKSAEKPEMEKKEEACKLIEENLTETLEQFTAKKRRFNDEVYDEKNSTSTEDEDPYYWTNVSNKPPFVVGEKAIRIPPSEPYELYWPIRYGKLNVQNRSIQQVKSALEHIFAYAITEKLNVKLNELKDYQVFLIVGDRIESADVNIFVDVLFRKFQFKALAIHQESVCAAYGVGMATCCVVDIGHMKTSICCIDEGIFLPHTRLFFQYGGYNINRALLYTLQHSKRHYFSYKECDPSNLRDEEGLNLLKESLCNMRRDTLEVENYEFRARTKGQPTKVYKLNVSDALVVSPMALFYTGLLEPVDSVRPKNTMIVEDLVDEELKTEIRKVVGDEELYLIPEISRKVLPVDHAIIESIKSIENLELRQNLISNIVLIGGSARYEGLTTVMEDRVFEQLPEELTAIEKVEVVSNEVSRNVDPRYMSWKGASVCCGFESFSDCWVSKQEWELFGIRILRERAPFTWL